MKILVAYQSAWWNAPAYYTYMLIKALLQNGHKVYFAGKNGIPAAERIKKLNVEMIDVDLYPSIQDFRKSYMFIKRMINSEQIDLFIPVSAPSHVLFGLLKFNKFKDIPIIKFCLDNIPPKKHLLNKYLHNRLTDILIFPGKATLKRYEGYFDTKRSDILYAPIDIESFCGVILESDLKQKYQIPEDKIIISFIGRFSPEKGIFFLLEIIKKVVEKNQNVHFIISGSEEQIKYSDVSQKVNELRIQNFISIIHKVDDVRELISITDIGLLSSRYSEYICRIALEMMAFKIPVVAPSVNVIPEVIEHKYNGYIYPIEDINTAADYTIELIQNPELRMKMGKNGYQRILDNFSLNLFAAKIDNIISQLTKND